MKVALQTVSPILRIADVCELLRISEPQFYKLKDQGFFDRHGLLVEVQPRIDSCPRYAGEPFVEWLGDKSQVKLSRALMREVQASGVSVIRI